MPGGKGFVARDQRLDPLVHCHTDTIAHAGSIDALPISGGSLTFRPEFLLSIDFGKGDRQRMLQLAERSEAGTLTAEEQTEFDSYLHVGNLLAVMQSKARLALKRKPHGRPHS